MKHISSYLPSLAQKIRSQVGFTMIELLIVISILGILAVAVLSAINPIEQINRGRDTGSQSDAEQMIGATERYYAYNGAYPWQGTAAGSAQTAANIGWAQFDGTLANTNAIDTTTELLAKEELKQSFVDRINSAQNPIFIYNTGVSGDATYVCFNPQSRAFQEQATARCTAGLPADLDGAVANVCPGDFSEAFFCLP